MSQHPLSELMETTMQKIHEIVDAETIIGKPVAVSSEITLIPISKMAFGFASGGSDFDNKSGGPLHFGGGSGAGVTVSPVGFLSISNGEIKFIPMAVPAPGSVDSFVSGLPDLVGKFKDVFTKDKSKKEEEAKAE